MARWWTVRRLVAIVLAWLMCGVVLGATAQAPKKGDDAAALDAEVGRLYQAGKYTEAIEIAKQSLATREKSLGPEHPDVGRSLNFLAVLYRAQGRKAEAEPFYKRSLAIREKALGPEHLDVGNSLNNLAELYRDQGRYGEAEPLYKRSLAITERALGPEHPSVGISLNNLALLYGTRAEAEPLYKRSLPRGGRAIGLDATAWYSEGAEKCGKAVGISLEKVPAARPQSTAALRSRPCSQTVHRAVR